MEVHLGSINTSTSTQTKWSLKQLKGYTALNAYQPQKQCSKLVVARLPETTKTSFGQPVFRKNKRPVARDCPAFDLRTTWIFS